MTKRNTYRVHFNRITKEWEVVHHGTFGYTKKKFAVEACARAAALWSIDRAGEHGKPRPSQVIVHGKSGRIQFERTYPRSSDPKRSKG
jgi:hypothetical protein